MGESYLIGSPLVFIACPLVSSVVDSVSESYLRITTCFYCLSSSFLCGGFADYYELPTYLKPSADSGGTNSNGATSWSQCRMW